MIRNPGLERETDSVSCKAKRHYLANATYGVLQKQHSDYDHSIWCIYYGEIYLDDFKYMDDSLDDLQEQDYNMKGKHLNHQRFNNSKENHYS